MRESQYVAPYLRRTANPKTRYTVGTFLAITLTGTARSKWADTYQRALENSLQRLVELGDVEKVASVMGGIAYIRNPQKCTAKVGLQTLHRRRTCSRNAVIATTRYAYCVQHWKMAEEVGT